MRLLPDPKTVRDAHGDPAGQPHTKATDGISRRQVLRWGIVGGAVVLVPISLPGCGDDGESPAPAATPTAAATATPTPTPSVLSAEEQRTLRALAGQIIPSDASPGALDCDADLYIDRLLSIVPDVDTTHGEVFAGGPFSGRNPLPDNSTGTPSNQFPPAQFQNFLPLTRLQRLSWRARILGSAAVPELAYNSAVSGPLVGLREQYHVGLAALQATSHTMFGTDFDALSSEQRDTVLAASDADFVDLVTGHVIEGMFSVPEYGGNRDRQGWQLLGYDGDSQPLGYTIYDASAATLRERPDKPMSTANPNETFAGFDPEVQALMRVLVRFAGQPRFP